MIIRGAVFVVLLGLWAGMGWAAGHTVVEVTPCPETWVKESGPGACRYEIGYSQWHTVEVDGMPVDCRDRMEAAMRAMDRFLGTGFDLKWKDDDKQPYLSVLRQWDAVKRECWRGQ